LIYGNTASEAGSAFLSIPLIALCTAFIVFLYRILSDNIRNRYAQGALIVVMAVINLLMIFGYIDLAFRLRIHILFRDARQLMWSPIQCINREQQKLGQPPDGIRECINEQPCALAFDRVTYWRGKDEYVLDVLAWFHGGHLVFRYSSRSGTWEKLWHSKPVSSFVREINYVREGSISFYGRRIWVEAKE
jgi:hypothetical protein